MQLNCYDKAIVSRTVQHNRIKVNAIISKNNISDILLHKNRALSISPSSAANRVIMNIEEVHTCYKCNYNYEGNGFFSNYQTI